ncbi:hypothetical protein [Marvinbryantia formatexigens]|uniref:hypothetical protein n=1 Tax=Marvinbryantia formatexigens TaxID=168384 RepID=UPI0009458AC1|nr:hypothetical protein [Marvinbryantia formatexigens]UWO24065.1 hypothetical protein NQ534_16705 [Marvinbryantia formatexigens DSM 14469]
MKKIALRIPRHVLNIEAVKRKEKRMDNLKANKIIAVDFDGTLCENKYPEIGEPRRNVIDYVKTRREHGDKIILWTCRVGEMLENAVKWCAERGLKFDAVNANLPEVIESFGGDTRKIFANEYIDDRNYPCRIDTVTNVLYVCDAKKCGDICPDKDKTCRHTSDITHAKNFTEGDYGYYWETDATAENDSDVLRQILNTVHGRDSAEFLGKLVDVVEDWLAYKGITADDVPNEERTDAENEAIICGEDYDLLAEGFRTVIHSGLIPKTEEKCEKSSMESWAEREVEIACERENPDRKPGKWDYGCACHESALKAFLSLLEDGHSGLSISITKQILNRLIDGKPLTPIEDTDDIWEFAYRIGLSEGEPGFSAYQCKRMSSLFKTVYTNGTVKYEDNNRCCGVDVNSPDVSFHNKLITDVVDDMYPITMPYCPEDKPFVVYREDFLTDAKNGDYDTVAFLYLTKPDGERVEINRFFKEDKDGRMCEIGFEEFEERRKMHEERLWNLKIEKLESIFGFKFYDWQKRYLKGDDMAIYGRGRGSGKTFIYCLRVLLEERAAFRLADFRSIRDKRGKFLTDVDCRERDHLILLLHSLQTINAKLVSAGFKTNLILDGEEE